MTEFELWGDLTRLTNGVVHPLLEQCRRLGAAQQRNVVNEIRNAAAHVEWAYRTDAVSVEQLDSARRHLLRAAVDACKAAWRSKLATSAPTQSTLDLAREHLARVDTTVSGTTALREWVNLVGDDELDCDVLGAPWPIDASALPIAVDAIRAFRESDLRIVVRHHIVAANTYADIAPWWRALTRHIVENTTESAAAIQSLTSDLLDAHRRFELQELQRLCVDLHNDATPLANTVWDALEQAHSQLDHATSDALLALIDTLVAALDTQLGNGFVARALAERATNAPDVGRARDLPTPFFDPTVMRVDHGVVWFVDLTKSSSLPSDVARREVCTLHDAFANALRPASAAKTILAANTWGDGLMAAFASPEDGIEALRAFVDDFMSHGTTSIRVGLEYGPIDRAHNPITGLDVLGPTVVTAARLEPCAEPERAAYQRAEILCRTSVAEALAARLQGLSFSSCFRTVRKTDSQLGDAGVQIEVASLSL